MMDHHFFRVHSSLLDCLKYYYYRHDHQHFFCGEKKSYNEIFFSPLNFDLI